MVFDQDVPGQRRTVRENDVVTYPTVMCYVGLGHKQVAGSYFGQTAASLGAPMQGYKLPKGIALPGKEPASFPVIFEVGRCLAGGDKWEEDAIAPELRWAIYYTMTGHSHVVVEYDVVPDDRVRAYDAITAYFSLWADYRCRVN